MYSGQ